MEKTLNMLTIKPAKSWSQQHLIRRRRGYGDTDGEKRLFTVCDHHQRKSQPLQSIVPTFVTEQTEFHYNVCTKNTARLNFCPMLNHLPREDRAKFINKLTSQCKNCLKENPFCYCPNHSPGRCGDCFKSIYICGHERAE